jgi:hypothetical protein
VLAHERRFEVLAIDRLVAGTYTRCQVSAQIGDEILARLFVVPAVRQHVMRFRHRFNPDS